LSLTLNLVALKHLDICKTLDVTVIPCAVGDRNAIVPFNVCNGYNENLKRDHTFSGSVKKPVEHLAKHPWCKFDKQIDVRMVRLDDFCQLFSLPPLSLIWCDVQGAEDLVIEGAKNALSSCQYFYTEYYDMEMYEGQLNGRLQPATKMEGVGKVDDNVLFENHMKVILLHPVIKKHDPNFPEHKTMSNHRKVSGSTNISGRNPHDLVVSTVEAAMTECLTAWRDVTKPTSAALTAAHKTIGARQDCDLVVGLNTHTYFWRQNWWSHREMRSTLRPGVYGATASHEQHPHLRTPCIAFAPSVMNTAPVTNREEPHGLRLDEQFLAMGEQGRIPRVPCD
jgi:FkbM family methyltransferase